MENAIGLVETSSMALGHEVTDAMVKRADTTLVEAHTVCPGKFIALVTGTVADVEKSVDRGIEVAGHTLVQDLIIPNIHPQLIPAIRDTSDAHELDALGIVEFFSVSATIIAADAAAKKSEVQLINVRLANAMGGKGYFTLTGSVEAVNSAVDEACNTVKGDGILIERVVIPRPDKSLEPSVL